MDLLDSLALTFDHAYDVISAVGDDQYDSPTPCPDWTVRALLDHMIGVVVTIGCAAAGKTSAGFELAADPAAQFRAAAVAAMEAWRMPGALEAIVHGAAGSMPGRVWVGINLLDTATHTWDLATATGQAATLPEDVATGALEASTATISPEIRRGRFGAELPAADGCTATDALVAFLGRDPRGVIGRVPSSG